MSGVKGKSGRKSKFKELADAMRLHATFLEVQNQEELEERIRSGKFSIEDRVKLTAMEGDTTILNRFIQKVYPDNIDLTTKGQPIVQISKEVALKNDINESASGDSER